MAEQPMSEERPPPVPTPETLSARADIEAALRALDPRNADPNSVPSRPLMCGVTGCSEDIFVSVEEAMAHERTHVMKPHRVGTQLRLSPDLHARLKAAADERGLALNFLAERLLSEALDDLIPAAEFRLTRRPTDG